MNKIKIQKMVFLISCLLLSISVLISKSSPIRQDRKGFVFDGRNYIKGSDVGVLNEFTLALWVRIDQLNNPYNSLVHSQDWEKKYIHIFWRNNKKFFVCINGAVPGDLIIPEGDAGHFLNKWTHMAITYNVQQKEIKLFINGKLTSQKVYKKALVVDFKNPFWFGGWNKDPRSFTGSMDDIRLYNRSLDEKSIRQIFEGKEVDNSPVMHWGFDKKSGKKVTDLSENNHHAKIMAMNKKLLKKKNKSGKNLTKSAQYLPGAPVMNKPLHPADVKEIKYREFSQLRKKNPLFRFSKIAFVKRLTYKSSHFYTDFIDGPRLFGGNLCILDLETGKVKDIVPSMNHGIFDRYDISFDGKSIVFDWKKDADHGFRLYEVYVDGTGLRQLTFDPPDEKQRVEKYCLQKNGIGGNWEKFPYKHFTDDMHPAYLPDGGICFVSSRCEFGILCDGPDKFTTLVMYRIDKDGRNMKKLSNSSVTELAPSMMSDGRILYTRWEYVDKGAVSVKCLWAMNPDGSGSVEIYGNDILDPNTILFGRQIPGHDNMFSALGTPHCCPIPGLGTVITIDINKDIRTLDPIKYVTPFIKMDLTGHRTVQHYREGEWRNDQIGPLYKDPYPLSREYFLVSYNPDKNWNESDAYGLYCIDDKLNHYKIYEGSEISCWQPMPLVSRKKPLIKMVTINEELKKKNLAHVIVTDIYQGLEGIERGRVKYIRVNEQVPRPWTARRRWPGDTYDQQHAVITLDMHLGLKVQYGIVPVEQDGSASFLVPADKNIFFQVLDENYMELQRERTFINYVPGEIRTCVGCHEKHSQAPTTTRSMMALSRPAVLPGPQPGEVSGKRPLYYPSDVQPVFDKNCIKCHGEKNPKADLDLTGTETPLFSKSYESILNKQLIVYVGENHPKWGNVHYVPPLTIGSHVSKLIQTLIKGHNDVKLTQEEMIRLTTWVDSNGQYYGSYYGRRNIKYKGHPNYRPVPTISSALGIPPLPEGKR